MPVTSHVMLRHPAVDIPPDLLDLLRQSAAGTAATGKPDPRALAAVRRCAGLMGTGVPAEYGGSGGDTAAVNAVVERVATVDPSMAIILFQHFAVCSRITEWGNDEQRSRLLPALASGAWLAASAWSESGAGAAKRKLRTTGTVLSDGRWQLNGAKSFATSAGIADVYLVLVQTCAPAEDPTTGYGADGQTFFLVAARNPGLVANLTLDLAGMRGSATGFISLHDCEVSDRDRLGPVDQARTVIAGVRETGATLGAVSVGIAQAALDLAREHVENAGALNPPSVAHRLVEWTTRVEAARALVQLAGQRTSANPGLTCLQSKLFASAVAEQVSLDAAHLLGSTGYVAGHRINTLIADARAVALMGPTNELCLDLAVTA